MSILRLLPLALLPALAATAIADDPGPVPHRVYQRDKDDQARIPLGDDAADARLVGPDGKGVEGVKVEGGQLVGVPTGGPYTIEAGDTKIGPIFVGDLWVLSGQSNMEGVGDLVEVTPPHPLVMALGMDGTWVQAEEPLHWLVDSPDPVHSGDPATREERSKQAHRNRRKGSGLGLPFAVAMVEATKIPVGLVPTAHGGTSMAQWDPSKKGEGGNSLYGSMMRQVNLAGGAVKGILWYQGESDANEGAARVFPQVFADFIAAVRQDLGQPDLPFYYVQIGRFILPKNDPKWWNAVQDAQRLLVERVPHTAVVPTADLELDDLIHVGTQGHKRLGRRLAWAALHDLFNYPIGTPIGLESVARGEGNTLRLKFKGVDLGGTRPRVEVGQEQTSPPGEPIVGLQPLRHIGGFSVRQEDGTKIPLIFDAVVDPQARDTVVLQLSGPPPSGANLWYGWGFDPYCNLADGLDMAAPVFGPIPLDEVAGP